MAVLGIDLVLTWFLTELTDSNLLIGFLAPIESGSWYFLQIVLSGYVQRRPRSLPLYRAMAAIRVAATGLLALLVYVLEDAQALTLAFMVLFTVNSVAAGVAALPFLNVIGKTIPADRRGMFIGWRRLLGGLLGIAVGGLVKVVLAPGFLPFPDNYALLFLLGFLITIMLVGTFSMIREPTEQVETAPVGLSAQLGRIMRLPKQDSSYRRYLVVRLLIAAASTAIPFYAVYARRVLNVREDMVGTYLIWLSVSNTVSNFVSGQLGDRRGNRALTRLAAVTVAMLPCLALLVGRIFMDGFSTSLIYVSVFMLMGLHRAAIIIGGSNYVLDLAPPAQRPMYVGLSNGLAGLALFLSPLGGVLVDQFGFEILFIAAAVCGLLAAGLSLGLVEPRQITSKA
jgi:MFS family permease